MNKREITADNQVVPVFSDSYKLGLDIFLKDGEHKLKIIDVEDNLANKSSISFYFYDAKSGIYFLWNAWIFSPWHKIRKHTEKILLIRLKYNFKFLVGFSAARCPHTPLDRLILREGFQALTNF